MKTTGLIFIVILGLLASCGQSTEELLIGKYWLEPEDEEILLFEENGVVNEIVYMEKASYQLAGDSLQIGISGWGKYYYQIKEITEDRMVVQDPDANIWELKKVTDGDLLIGEWDGKLFGKDMTFEFSDGELVITDWDEYEDVYEDFYRIEGNKILASSSLYEFEFEFLEDVNRLKLVQGEKEYMFKRD